MTAVDFACKSFDELSAAELYAMLALRSQVFVVEQQCVYLDPDGLDLTAHHLFGWSTDSPRALVCGVRLLAPGVVYDDASIGRVVTAPAHRGSGLGRTVMRRALLECARLYPGQAVTIGAQRYLEQFYAALGFTSISEPYEEDGIPHVKMRRPA
jgi:ElaA protein